MNNEIINIQSKFKDAIIEIFYIQNIPSIFIKKDRLKEVCKFLQNRGFCRIVDIFGIDNININNNTKNRFEVIYHLSNIEENQRIFIKVDVGEGEELESIADIFFGAKVYELECSDMYGIVFRGNELGEERFLLWRDFKGYPLRKDF